MLRLIERELAILFKNDGRAIEVHICHILSFQKNKYPKTASMQYPVKQFAHYLAIGNLRPLSTFGLRIGKTYQM